MEMNPEVVTSEVLTLEVVRQRLHNISPVVLDAIDANLMGPGNHSGWKAAEQVLGSCAINSLTNEGSLSLLPDVLQARAEQYALRDAEKLTDRMTRLRVMEQTKHQVREEFRDLLDEPRMAELDNEIEQVGKLFVTGPPTIEIPDAPEELRGELKAYYEQPAEQRQYDPYAWAHDAALFYIQAEARHLMSSTELAAFKDIQAVDEAFAALAQKKYELDEDLVERAAVEFEGSTRERQILDAVEQEIEQVEDDLLAKAEALLLLKRSEDFAQTGDGIDLVHGIRAGEQLVITTAGGLDPINLTARRHPDASDEIIFEWMSDNMQGRQVSIGRETEFDGKIGFERRLIRNDALRISGDAGMNFSGPAGRVRDIAIGGKSLREAKKQHVLPEAAVVSEEPALTQVEKKLIEAQQGLLKRFQLEGRYIDNVWIHSLYGIADNVTLMLGHESLFTEPALYRTLKLHPRKRKLLPHHDNPWEFDQVEFEVVADSWQNTHKNAALEPGQALYIWGNRGNLQLTMGGEILLQNESERPHWTTADGNELALIGLQLDDQSVSVSRMRPIVPVRVGSKKASKAAMKKAWRR